MIEYFDDAVERWRNALWSFRFFGSCVFEAAVNLTVPFWAGLYFLIKWIRRKWR